MQMKQAKGLEALQVWQLSLNFAEKVCKQVLPSLPKEEKWALVDQLRRSAQSIPANLAEGYGRYYYQDAIRYCYIARGSLEESFSHLTLAFRLGYLEMEHFRTLQGEIEVLRRMLNGYIVHLKKTKRGASEPGVILREESGDYDIQID
jgi:four helix bundle protein